MTARTSDPRARLRTAIDDAVRTLADAGVSSPRVDAEELAAHTAGTTRSQLLIGAGDVPDDVFYARYDEHVAARARRIPLQHITGVAAFGPVTVQVGPGVFIPRPETEALYEWATRQPGVGGHESVIVDLCTGSGALALALARHWPGARVIAVDNSADALRYARVNVGGEVDVRDADVTAPDLYPELNAGVDLLVANPPYIPLGAELEPEVADHDPEPALFGGADGLSVIDPIVRLARRWLRPGGLFGVEHDDSTSAQVVQCIARTAAFEAVTPHHDLTRRPRFVTARRKIA